MAFIVLESSVAPKAREIIKGDVSFVDGVDFLFFIFCGEGSYFLCG